MKPHRFQITGVALLFFGAWMCAGDPAGAQRSPPVLVVMGASAAATDIGLGKLRSAFQSQATDFHGARLIPFNLPVGHPARQLFDQAVLGLAPERVGAFWVDQRIRYSLLAPRSISTPEMILRVVASMRSAIGYVQMNPAHVPAGVRVLTVDGKASTAAGYALQGR